MAANDPVIVDTVTNGDPARQRPMVFEELMEVEPDGGTFLAIYNALGMAGKKQTVWQQEFTSFEEWPYIFTCQVTAAATAAATTITVDSSLSFTARAHGTNTRTGEMIRLGADPGSSTTLTSVSRGWGTTPAAAMVSGDVIVFGALVAEEQWTRPSPRSQGTGNHIDYASVILQSSAITWQRKYSQTYGIQEEARIERADKREWERKQNRELWLSEPKKDTSVTDKTVYALSGVRYMAKRYNNWPVPEGVTVKHINKIVQRLKKLGGARNLVAFMGGGLMSESSQWAQNSGFTRSSGVQDNGPIGWGAPGFKNPFGVGVRVETDFIFDETGLDDEIILVNFDYLEPVEFGQMEFRKPSAEVPTGIADLGGGTIQSMMVRGIGIHWKLPIAACAMIKGAKYFRN